MIPNSKASLHDAELPIQYQAFTPLMSTAYLLPSDVVVLPKLSQSFPISPLNNQCPVSVPHASHPPDATKHYITLPIFLKHSISTTSPQLATASLLSCSTPPPPPPYICHTSQCFPRPEAQHGASPAILQNPASVQHTTFPLIPTAVPWNVFTPATARSPPLWTELPHTQ